MYVCTYVRNVRTYNVCMYYIRVSHDIVEKTCLQFQGPLAKKFSYDHKILHRKIQIICIMFRSPPWQGWTGTENRPRKVLITTLWAKPNFHCVGPTLAKSKISPVYQ